MAYLQNPFEVDVDPLNPAEYSPDGVVDRVVPVTASSSSAVLGGVSIVGLVVSRGVRSGWNRREHQKEEEEGGK